MDVGCCQAEVGKLIRDKAEELNDVGAALAFVHHHVLDKLQTSESVPPVPDVFPPCALQRVSGQLCRCRGMIQEVEPNLSLYRASSLDFFGGTEDENTTMLEATLLYVIPVPGNSYFYDAPPEGQSEERAAASNLPAPGHTSGDRKRRERPDRQLQNSDVERDSKQPRQEPASRCGEVPQSMLNVPLYQKLNLPHPPLSGLLHTACVVTVIQHSAVDGNRLQLNDVVDFFGFLDDDLAATGSQSLDPADEFGAFASWHAEQLPPSLLSRMTCISWRHVFFAPMRPLASHYFESKRSLVVLYLANTICQGDALLAEYVLLHLCARVITHERATPIGDIPLRVEAQTIDPEAWSSFMRSIAPVGEVLFAASQLSSVDLRIAPRQDHMTNVLRTGALQLANGTHVTLDCQAVSKASSALHDALFTVIHKQVLPLQYPYQVHELPIDLSFLALSTVRLSEEIDALQLATSVRWLPELPMAATHAANISAKDVRDYLSHVRCVRRGFDCEGTSQARRLADKLVDFSKSEPAWNNHDPFIHNNSFSMAAALMRACAASFGRERISDDDVEHVLRLEKDRVARCC
ncbi:E2F target protein 1 [Trypanosoma conorhini]|uniref:E2F target protein 1 n=1 Tax=Trypanosoma conorhini TaxID=83891 RepID=A0A3R7LSF4_9TRYP|nr:E2F target protein 1 [Trypanosoma conorhini]RNF19774.1 E2F target protein 1 [Trypanosoma conorhini]